MLKEYVEQRLSWELEQVKKKRANNLSNELNVYEETLIYYYTIEGYEQLNKDLIEGKENEYEKYLNQVLAKLPNYEETVYRGVELSQRQIERYKTAFKNNSKIIESAFVSSSKSQLIANEHSKANVIMTIISKTGKEITIYSKYDYEQEVLFKSKSAFHVLSVDESEPIINIILEEIENE